jgi:DNA-binding transcriptional LysR family regulator
MDWDDLKIFLALHRSPSIRAAAERLGVSHSTVSRRLQGLEATLGAKLFLRHADGFSPTETANQLVAHAERMESDVQHMQMELLGRDARLSGRLRVSVPPPLAQHLVMPMLAEVIAAYPAIDLEVISTLGFTDLDRQHADIAIRFQHVPDAHLVGRRLPEVAYSIYATPQYIESHQFHGPKANAEWLIWSESDRSSAWFRGTPLPECRLGALIPDPLAQLAAARAGIGMVYSPCFIADVDLALTRVPGAGVMKDRPCWILTHPDARTSQRVRVFVAALVAAFQKHRVALAGAPDGLAP